MLSGQVAFSFLYRGEPTLSRTTVSVAPSPLVAAGTACAGTAVAAGAGAAWAGAAGAGAAGAGAAGAAVSSGAPPHAIAANAIIAANGKSHRNLPFLPNLLILVPPVTFNLIPILTVSFPRLSLQLRLADEIQFRRLRLQVGAILNEPKSQVNLISQSAILRRPPIVNDCTNYSCPSY